MNNFQLIFCILTVVSCLSAALELSIKWNEDLESYDLIKGRVDGYAAFGSLKNDINATGWAYLELSTNPKDDDVDQAYTAGLLEGLVTSDLIDMHMYNTVGDYCKDSQTAYCSKFEQFIVDNFAWMQAQIDQYAKTDPYWHQVDLFLHQVQGLIDGYGFHQRPKSELKQLQFKPDIHSLLIMQIAGDLGDLESALSPSGLSGVRRKVVGDGSCSALIKLLPGNTDLLTAQDTWQSYSSMLRILKRYNFYFHLTPGDKTVIPGSEMSFSSYPGALWSGDDFYIMSSGLVSQETTIGNSNDSRWSYIKPQDSVLEGIRNVVANRLASNGKQWMDYFSKYNSGTYNNQWMIVDYNKFVSGSSTLQDGLLSVLEQIPGMIVARDVTDVLRKQSYWSSFNIAYYPEIFNASGGWEMVSKYGEWFSFLGSPRQKIFNRDHDKVKDIESMTRLMRYNNYEHDPLSACNCTPPYSAENAISARCDLNPANGSYPFEVLGHRPHGGTDMKLTSYSMYKDLEFIAISGPTYDDLQPFQWSKSDFEKTLRHAGHPDLWMFKPIQHKWRK